MVISLNGGNMKKKYVIIVLSILILIVAGYFSYPHLLREFYFMNNNVARNLSESDYKEGRSLLSSRAKTKKLVKFIKEYELYKINQLLESNSYKDARNFHEQSTLYYENNEKANSMFLKYEIRNFDELKDEYIEKNLEWSYDIDDIYVPKEYKTTWNRDFFGEWYSTTYQSGGGYSYSDFTGAYLYLVVENNFISLDIKGDVIVTAKEKTSVGDVVGGGLGALAWGAMAGLATQFFGGSTEESNAAFMAGAKLGSQELWDKERNTTVKNIVVKASNKSRQNGRVSLRGKEFEEDHTPKIKNTVWSVYGEDINVKFDELEVKNMVQADVTKIFSLSQIYYRKPKIFDGGGGSFYGFTIPADLKNKLYSSYNNWVIDENIMKIVCRPNKNVSAYNKRLEYVLTADSLYSGEYAKAYLTEVSNRKKEEIIKNQSLIAKNDKSEKNINKKFTSSSKVDEKTSISNETEEIFAPPPPPPPPDEKEPVYFIAVEKMPKPIGGIAAIQKKIVYPELAKRAGVQGRVFVKAYVDEQGKVKKVELIKGIGAGCDEAAMKAVKEAKFRPGKQRGKKVNVQVTIPIVFSLN